MNASRQKPAFTSTSPPSCLVSMARRLYVAAIALACWPLYAQLPPAPAPAPTVHHSLQVELDPTARTIAVKDTITLSRESLQEDMVFSLNSNLRIDHSTANQDSLNLDSGELDDDAAVPVRRYRLQSEEPPDGRISLEYSGVIYEAAAQGGADYARSFSETSGIISEQGVFLAGASAWIPDFGSDLVTFDLQVNFATNAATWSAVSQGSANGENAWRSMEPMEEIFLVAADFTVYSREVNGIGLLAYLRTPEPALAARYLDAGERYLNLYQPLLGDYPYSKFALVENFLQTGYGMPSFTLLGDRIIRFPFILESSYPHEILHNWWGNGVYPDYRSGNWSEGLTAYLADHLFREMRGAGAEYRKDTLARYKNYVTAADDFPLSRFTSRNSAATQAVGYGKSLMLWHMLRLEAGDELFLHGLRELFANYRYRRAAWGDIARLYSAILGRDMNPFFEQWVNRTGAPELSIAVQATDTGEARLDIHQTQPGPAWALTVPVALFYNDEPAPRLRNLVLTQKTQTFLLEDHDRLQAVQVDPRFDVFRRLAREETPPTLGGLFGAGRIAFVLPDREPHWRDMAEAFGQDVDAEILYADQLERIPEDRSVWLLGRDNPHTPLLIAALAPWEVTSSSSGITLEGSEIAFENRSTVLVARHPDNPQQTLGWVHVDDPIAMPGMIEKLPHYGRYSWLSFTGEEPTNDISGAWVSQDSPMQWSKPGVTTPLAALPPTPPIAVLPPRYSPERLRQHAEQLGAVEMQGRGPGSDGLQRAALYIQQQFQEAGLQAIGDDYLHVWRESVPGHGELELTNVIGLIPGANQALDAAPLVLGAHYDHLGIDAESGRHYPGADDNASGVSVMIEVATRLARAWAPARPVIFVAFSGEETGLLGSRHFVNSPPPGFEDGAFFAMVNLDAVGRLEGRNLQVFASDSAREWQFMARGIGWTIGLESTFPRETIAASDHVSFLNAGIPAIHLFGGAHPDYHRPNDTADKLDGEGLSAVASWVEEALVYLGDRVEPLRSNLAGAEPVAIDATTTTAREASLGTIPDFAYTGEGVRISGVIAGSAAAESGLQENDVLLRFDGKPVADLQGYSNLLRASAPGARVIIEVRRGEQILTLQATLQAR